ncbi:MAG: putative RNA-binding protein (virulence factor B family) [Desulforhopalus sp.]|jgi:predicted RNA-binding protein (virulence factor B family)
MVEIGKINRLAIKNLQRDSIQLDGGDLGDITLTGKYDAKKYHSGDSIDVFIYVNKDQHIVATQQKPYATVGEFAKLTVVATSSAGAFLGWGLADDLFVPKSEQLNNMMQGKSYVVYIFHSAKSNRVTASSKLDKYLNLQPPQYADGDPVDLLVYAETDLGYNAVVNGSHVGMIYANEVFQKLVIGQRLQGYIKKVREDSKIDLMLQQAGYQRVDDISKNVLNIITECGGMVTVTDKSPAEDIYDLFGVSKKVFKKAIGALYKKNLVTLTPGGIELREKDSRA